MRSREGLINSVRPEHVTAGNGSSIEGFFCEIKERFDGLNASGGKSDVP